ncbi:camp-regulated phosphoprotein/endosulfine conserved region-domain-containing protein [Pyronema domesticum]|uniref:mRNA stability protein n=1 Tax=Pyronema omphalodes (strain CBS 100304) TaxID=1076935 RepID=U4LW83_PYROM|nr:camp-regulated phosphoprotein/endosulfine conserved region-domain-containing protein [Pyronema domesticum]KAI5820422.1 camp-regulated phosphoprotein/endosulfine conserved region-domain-containing protein [Pyronema omphalodes]CCX33346.1 Similar to Uncharacterized protein C10F6.16; acc. no. P79058 [Pyronema omphalodes CBS 100304]
MLPHQRNKVDISSLTAEEQKLFRLYGKLPTKKDVLKNKLKERKYFDSGDYALSKAGKASDVGVTNIGSQHPLPENIPHIHSPAQKAGEGSPVNEQSHLHSSPMASEAPITADQVEESGDEKEEDKVEEKAEEKKET